MGLYHGVSLDKKSVMDVPRGPDMVFLYRRPAARLLGGGRRDAGPSRHPRSGARDRPSFRLIRRGHGQHRGFRRRLRCHTRATHDPRRQTSGCNRRRETAKLTTKSSRTDDEGFPHLRGSKFSQATTAVGGAGRAHPVGCLWPLAGAQSGPTPEEYVAHVGGDAQLVPAGQLMLDGRKLRLRPAPNGDRQQSRRLRRRLSGLPHPQQEAAGQGLRPPSSCGSTRTNAATSSADRTRRLADCFAVQRGRAEKWLTPEGLEEVCRFISPAKGDSMHFSGSHRCEAMRQCYADPTRSDKARNRWRIFLSPAGRRMAQSSSRSGGSRSLSGWPAGMQRKKCRG